MLNLSLKELRLIAKNRNINGYESMSKDKLLRIINNKRDRKSVFKLKKEEAKKSLYKSTTNSLFKSKRKKRKKSLHKPSKKNIFKLEIKKIIKSLHDSKIKRDRKIEEIEKILYELKEEEDYYKPVRTGNAFSSNYIEYKSNGDKSKTLSIRDYLDEIKPYVSDIINDHETKCEWKIQLTMLINFFFFKRFLKNFYCAHKE